MQAGVSTPNRGRGDPGPGTCQGLGSGPTGIVDARRSAGTPPVPRADRRAERYSAAEQGLKDAYKKVRSLGAEPESVDIPFQIALDFLAEAKACSDLAREDLAWLRRERDLQERLSGYRPAVAADPVIADAPGSDHYPSPEDVQTAAELVDALRWYWTWAGKPSYRAMERQCGRRFAASTIHAALHSAKLPSQEMIQAIITGCGGSKEHRQAFVSAWRRLEMQRHSTDRPAAQLARTRTLYQVKEPA